MNSEDSTQCFQLALTGTPFREIALLKDLDEPDVRRAVESEVAARVDVDEFPDFDGALDFLRLGRLQRGLWASAAGGSLSGTRQVMELMEQRNESKKSHLGKTLNQAVRDMLDANGVGSDDEEYEDE